MCFDVLASARFDVSNPASFLLTPERFVDTPGLPYGLLIRRVHGDEGLVLADHQAGLRLYGSFDTPPSAVRAPAPALWAPQQRRLTTPPRAPSR